MKNEIQTVATIKPAEERSRNSHGWRFCPPGESGHIGANAGGSEYSRRARDVELKLLQKEKKNAGRVWAVGNYWQAAEAVSLTAGDGYACECAWAVSVNWEF